ncbi:hypothetical protein UCRPA7_3328 [Phaeoacremonium minimum UCRPA7]|uniref:Transmembrane protein n=1 Tax=Phaeoacremonium minimum (strain UCR-PA7) TaxID=1286976 RepID=R8BPF0_PHAM7|nr:hypothetical protein UCRPA7_3328 [Phaeoacremonium minimum UCRPA7]EOO01209.1 hypothetical protein UCRPA7_3328 [Phaeoacremonium minimum UCRPA7]
MVLTTSYSSGAAIIYPVAEPTITSSNSASPTGASHGHGGLSTSAKIGIGVGAAVGGVLLLVLIALAVWRMRKSRADHVDTSQNTGDWDMVDANRLPPPPPVPTVPVVYTAYHEKEPTSPGPSIATTAVASSTPQYPSQAELHGQSHVRSFGSAQELDSYTQSYRTVSPMQELYGSPTSPSELSHDPLTQPTQVYYPPVPYRAGAQSPGWH